MSTTETIAKKEKTVKIRLPRTKEDSADVYVSVNDRSWLIQRGVEVEVPECVAEVLRNQDVAIEKAWAYNDSVIYKVTK